MLRVCEVESCFFTIFIPTFNRKNLLARALDSINQQSFRDFEVVIVDDGSTDDTAKLVEAWQEKSLFPLRYFWQENRGKPAAHNLGISNAKGLFTIILDSDDCLAPDVLRWLWNRWKLLKPADQKMLGGIEGLCADMNSGMILGDYFPQNDLISNYLETRHRLHVSGDKKNMIKTSVLCEYPFPLFRGEKHVRESLVWNRMARHYDFLYVNKIIELVEYQSDGLSKKVRKLRLDNPLGFRLSHLEMLHNHSNYLSARELYYEAFRYARYSFNSGVALMDQWKDLRDFWFWPLALFHGWLNSLRDRFSS